jgi:hypothetical protein
MAERKVYWMVVLSARKSVGELVQHSAELRVESRVVSKDLQSVVWWVILRVEQWE